MTCSKTRTRCILNIYRRTLKSVSTPTMSTRRRPLSFPMDLSQQELPLTSYFPSKPPAIPRKKNKLTEEDPSSVARPSKRTKNDTRRSVPHGLPTPTTSVRRRTRGARTKELPHSTDVLSPVVLSSDNDSASPTPSTLPRSPCTGAIAGLSGTSLATPSAGRQKTTNPTERESLSNHVNAGIATPQTPSRRVSEHRIDCSPLAPSTRPLPSKQNSTSRGSTFVLPLKRADGEPSKGLPMFPVSSSQSQYLLPIDATPKRKQRPQRIEHVISSQSQEERELALSSSLRLVTLFGLPIEHSPGK